MVSCVPAKQRKEDIFHSITLLDFLRKINIHLLKVGHKCCLGRTKKRKRKEKKILSFLEMRVIREMLTQVTGNLFLLINSPGIFSFRL